MALTQLCGHDDDSNGRVLFSSYWERVPDTQTRVYSNILWALCEACVCDCGMFFVGVVPRITRIRCSEGFKIDFSCYI
jgi:hypothetical protein